MEQIGTGSLQTDGALTARSVGAAKANKTLNERRLIAEAARLNARVLAREQIDRDHATEIDETPRPNLDPLTKAGRALAREYSKLKTASGLQLKTGLARNWDYFLVCIPLVAIKMIDLFTR